MVRRSVRSPVSLMLVFYNLDDITDGVGETDIVVITTVMSSSSWAWRSSEIDYIL